MNKMRPKMHYIVIFNLLFTTFVFATTLADFVDTSKCDQIIDKQLYKICYSYKYK